MGFPQDADISAYSFQHGVDAAYHWAVGAHTHPMVVSRLAMTVATAERVA